MEGPKTVWDLELVYTHIVILISLVLMFYFYIFVGNINDIFFLLSFVIVFCIVIIIFTNRHRHFLYVVDRKKLELKVQAFILFRSRIIPKNSIKSVYRLENNRWRWMRGKDEKLPIAIVLTGGEVVRIDQPPGKLEGLIKKKLNLDVETITSVNLTRMRIENER